MTDSLAAASTARPTMPRSPLAEATLYVHGLGCRHCVDRLTRALERIDGAHRASMDYHTRLATVTYDATRVDPRAFLHAIILEGADRGQTFDADLLTLRSIQPSEHELSSAHGEG